MAKEIYLSLDDLKKCRVSTNKCKKIWLGTKVTWEGTVLVNKPTVLNPNFYYDGVRKTNLYNCPDGVTMVGTDRARDGGVYTATYTPQEGYAWADDGTQTPITVTMTIYYKWIKWNVGTYYSAQRNTFPCSGVTLFSEYYLPAYASIMRPSYSINQSTGKFELNESSGGWTEVVSSSITLSNSAGVYGGISASGTNSFDVIFEGGSSTNPKWTTQKSTAVIGKIMASALGTSGNLPYYTIASSECKGDTNLGNVYSTNINDYPENAKQGDYWYTKTW